MTIPDQLLAAIHAATEHDRNGRPPGRRWSRVPDDQVARLLEGLIKHGLVQLVDPVAALGDVMIDRSTALLHWLIAAGVDITIGAAQHQGTAVIRVALNLDGPITLYGCNLAGLLAQARAWCEYEGITP
ncbi:hypothetical protein GCM10009555_017850 [Acrocarpospora macrocephala]|uniref:Uncharacterized protein n=1 Tax=Acrocarpospora macrocephala TaxID=150177 RepID=A0A5M3WEC7_9ACTN|nr:hypothetical protein [Acrocarpospora macrocephala]GES07445.1 hypothetical protein Amac_010400 [Acrocarpospora macrocephala]